MEVTLLDAGWFPCTSLHRAASWACLPNSPRRWECVELAWVGKCWDWCVANLQGPPWLVRSKQCFPLLPGSKAINSARSPEVVWSSLFLCFLWGFFFSLLRDEWSIPLPLSFHLICVRTPVGPVAYVRRCETHEDKQAEHSIQEQTVTASTLPDAGLSTSPVLGCWWQKYKNNIINAGWELLGCDEHRDVRCVFPFILKSMADRNGLVQIVPQQLSAQETKTVSFRVTCLLGLYSVHTLPQLWFHLISGVS